MKIRIHLVLIIFISASLLALFSTQNTSAEELSDEQLSRIRSNCLTIQGSLAQLHASDALLRVNRGQLYESIGTKLMNNFNNRLSNNGLDNKGLVTAADKYRVGQTNFIDSYRLYEQQLADTIKIDCSKEPAKFHEALLLARTSRGLVRENVVKLNLYIDDYRSAVSDFMLNFERVTGSN